MSGLVGMGSNGLGSLLVPGVGWDTLGCACCLAELRSWFQWQAHEAGPRVGVSGGP